MMETHVQQSDEAVAPFEDNNDQSEEEENSNDEGSDDGGGSDGDDADIGSDGENEEEDDDGGDGDDEEKGDGNTNAGWAEAMAKILGKKTLESKSGILTKNTELKKIKEKERQEQLEKKTQVDKKRAWEMMFREKPNIVKDRETERALQKIATRGVVQLFNAVRKHQKSVDDKVKEVGGSERKKAKILSSVSKKDFIDVLRRTDEGSKVAVKTEKEAAPKADEKPAWSVLRDDFMMGATMKDWDKDSDTEEAGTHTKEEASDSE